jgi:hypothetical protein
MTTMWSKIGTDPGEQPPTSNKNNHHLTPKDMRWSKPKQSETKTNRPICWKNQKRV